MLDVLFVNATYEHSIRREVNGTMLLATKLLQAGFRVDILRFCQIEHYQKDYPAFIREILKEIRARQPRCVSFYSLWPDYHIMLRIARELKAADQDIVIVFGGPQPSATPAETMDMAQYIDYLCTGEGENTVVPLFRYILGKQGDCADIPGLYYRRDGAVEHNEQLPPLCDLNTLPFWDERLIPEQTDPKLPTPYYYMPVDVGRGCPYNCTFCCTSYFWRRNYRLKTPERILEEIRHLHDKYGIRSFSFSHDAFTINNKLVEAVCDKLIEADLGLSWKCSTRMDCVTEELLLKMKQAGMTSIQLGVETGSKKMQKLINKNLDLDRTVRMVDFLIRHQIYCVLFFMYGFPEETEEDLSDTLNLIFSLMDRGNRYFTMSFCQFTPNTTITEQYLDQLEFDPEIKILYHSTFGFHEEEELIRRNKAIFPFYYTLRTPVRNNYQYLHFLVELNMKAARPARQLRRLYSGNYLQFYRDFYEAHRELLSGDIAAAERWFDSHPLEALLNITAYRNDPFRRQLEGLLRYSYCLHQVYEAPEDVSIQDIFDFNYVDLKLGHPIESYSPGRSEILIQKIKGKTEIQVLNIHWGE